MTIRRLLRGGQGPATHFRPMPEPPPQRVEEPFDGIPEWAAPSVVHFLDPLFQDSAAGLAGTYTPGQFLREAGNNLHVVLPWGNGWIGARLQLLQRVYADNDLFVRLLGFALERWFYGYDPNYLQGPLEDLDRALLESGSVWTVAGDLKGFRLDRRVSTETQSAMQQAVSHAGNASTHLREAWTAAYGQNPNPREAYSQAVQAVEALAVEFAEPNRKDAVLSSAIGHLRSNPQRFDSIAAFPARRIGSTSVDLTGFDVMLAQMDLLQSNQTDRHSPGDTRAELVPITQPQAEWAVQTAILLVETLRQGWLSRS